MNANQVKADKVRNRAVAIPVPVDAITTPASRRPE